MINLSLNFEEVNKFFGEVSNRRHVEGIVKKALYEVAKEVKKDAMRLIPRDTGELANSWREEEVDEASIQVGYDIIYAMYQHQGRRADGTNVIRNRPAGGESFFLKKPLDRNHKKYMAIFEDTVINELFG